MHPRRVSPTSWFEELVGFREGDDRSVRERLVLEGTRLRSLVNGRSFECGRLEVLSLAELRARSGAAHRGPTRVEEVLGEAGALHARRDNAGALFQVASQFNLLEMIGPHVTPEDGVTCYANDPTQGPACAIAAGAGTLLRRYFVDCGGGVGQSAERQIDCLQDLGRVLGNADGRLWEMRNGYALPRPGGLAVVANRIASLGEAERDALRTLLAIGVQWGTQVTRDEATHLVSQAFCSALPIAYAHEPVDAWEPFARLVLEATYEATLHAAVVNARNGGSERVFLTLVGGGAFGNPKAWILDALERALTMHAHSGLRVAIVSRHGHDRALARLLDGRGA
jgi:hypothetical protein